MSSPRGGSVRFSCDNLVIVPRRPRFSADDVHRVVRHVFDARPDALSHLAVGWGNENWRAWVRDESYIVKLGPPGSADKWAATNVVYGWARTATIPVPELVYFDGANDLVDGWTVRVFTWMEGVRPERVLGDPRITPKFFSDLSRALALLHSLPIPAFSSRLDGSAPKFDRWSSYIGWRLTRILERVRATSAFGESETERILREIEQLAPEVDAVARPAICHRDVYLDNLLATEDGHLAALLDFDGAEAWDPAIDVVKLRWLVFPNFVGSERAFSDAYTGEALWNERIRIAELVELLNAVPNAVMIGDRDFEASARARLKQVMVRGPST